MFDSDYFHSVNYTDYMMRGDRYRKLADETLDLLERLSLPHEIVLDFGCAVGHLLSRLDERVDQAYGTDISEWALNQCRQKNLLVLHEPMEDVVHDVIYSLDVFEHMEPDDLNEFMEKTQAKVIIFRIPVSEQMGKDYVLEVSRRDPTHIIRWDKETWRSYFYQWGFECMDLNLHTIYNSDGVYSGLAINYDKLHG